MIFQSILHMTQHRCNTTLLKLQLVFALELHGLLLAIYPCIPIDSESTSVSFILLHQLHWKGGKKYFHWTIHMEESEAVIRLKHNNLNTSLLEGSGEWWQDFLILKLSLTKLWSSRGDENTRNLLLTIQIVALSKAGLHIMCLACMQMQITNHHNFQLLTGCTTRGWKVKEIEEQEAKKSSGDRQ